MKKHLARRLLSLALALIMLLGILPTGLGLSTEAATPAEESKAQSLLTEINALEGNMYSKYVRVTTLKATNTSQLTTANNTLKGLSGNYIAVAKDPITAGGDTYYALNMGRSHAYNRYGVDVVQVVNDQLYGADPLGAINITYDETGSTTTIRENDTNYTQSTYPTATYSARGRFYLVANNGKYIKVSNDNAEITLQETKISTTLFVDYNQGLTRILVSGTYYYNRDNVAYKGMGLYTDEEILNAGYMGGSCPYFHLFKERTDRVNVDALYHALMEARTYLENPNAYDGSKFSAFLAEVEQGLYWYNQCNKDTQSSYLVSIYQPTVDEWAQSLTEATSRLKPYNEQINELQIPVTQAITNKDAIGNGNTYFMLGRDGNGFYRAIDIRNPSAATAEYKHYAVFAIDVVDGKVISDNLYGSFWISTTPGQGIGLLAYKSGYLNTKCQSSTDTSNTKVDMTTNNLQYFGINPEGSGEYPGAFYVHRGAAKELNYINCNGDSFCSVKNSNPNHRDYNMFFFQVSPLTLKLFKALEYVEPYAGGNADGRYDETLYAEFTATLDRALMEYREHRNTMEDSTLQPTLDALAEELQSYAGKLTNADSKASYIDIPVEILDFASDKLLFEFYSGSNGNRFSLQDHSSVQGSVANDTLLKPLVDAYLTATSRIKDELDTVNVAVRQNILLDELQDGHPVYAEYTVGYVAAAILTEWMADSTDTHQTTYASQVKAFNDGFADTQWQDAFWNRMVELYSAYKSGNATKKQEVLGTYDATVQKAGSDGMLLWSEVENGTAFDLAYYILSGVWKPVTDVLPDGRTYNTVVNECDTIRMYYDASIDRYVIASANELVYDGYAFYNTYPFMDRVEKKIFNLSPIDGLGFEKNGVKTDPSNYYGTQAGWQPEYANTNVSFTLHASGMFIYYEDQEQMFDFVGDDDVYFFINDKLVMDIGGTHSAAYFSMNLKEANEKYSLGMEDGGIYSFDMFYADRHTHGSNMKLSTNIKIVSPETITSKGQYAVEIAGTSTVGSNGKGGEMIDNQLVNVGDVVAYSFDITNRRDCPVTDLEFHDESLGVHLNGDNILTYPATLSTGKEVASLTNPTLCNGVVTQFKDLILEYTTLNSDGTLATGPVTEIAPTDMINLIRSKVTSTDVEYNYAPLDAGIYRVPVATAQQLGNLLKEGLPMECRISLYGFMRKTISTDAPYANELTTYCSYRRSANIGAEMATITGKASRILRVPAATEMPDIPRIDITLDYGKPVQIPLADITNQIFFEKDSPASVGAIVGYVEEGYNGQLLKKLPNNLLTLSAGDTVDGLQGTFTLRETSMEYAMWEFMEKVETLYAVVKLNNFNHAASGTQYEYALVELRLIPANMMYYEAEDFTGSEIGYMKKDGDVDYLFFDFDGTGADLQKNSAVYGNTDWETVEYDANGNALLSYWTTENAGSQKPILKRDESSVYLSTMSTSSGLFIAANNNLPKTALSGKQTFEVKLSGTGLSSSTHLILRAHYGNTSAMKSVAGTKSSDGQSYIFSAIPSVSTSATITRLGIYLSSGTTLKDVYVDYLYYGPAEKAPSKLKAAGQDVTQVLSRGSVDDWELKTDNVETADNQDFNPVNHRTYNLVVDRDNIPAEAFFVDFDGQGYGERYRDQPLYKGNNFDSKTYWFQETYKNGEKLSIDTATGHAVLNTDPALEDAALDEHFMQTIEKPAAITNQNGKSTPLNLLPGVGHIMQIRFRVENCILSTRKSLDIEVRLSDNATDNVSPDKGLFTIPLDAEEVFSGNYVTVTYDMDQNAYYTAAQYIDSFRVNFRGITNQSAGRILVDYIYLGPEQGMPQEVYGDYLYFGFENTASDKLRYGNTVYGSTSSVTQNYDTKEFWSSGTAGNTIAITQDSDNNSYLVFSDRDPDHEYNYVQAGKLITSSPFKGQELFTYPITGNDVFRIRFKVTGNFSIYSGETPGLSLQFDDGGDPAAYVALNSEMLDGNFHTLTMPLNTSQLITAMETKGRTHLDRIRINFSQIMDGTFTIDYIYIGPAELVDEVLEKSDHLFFDFTNDNSAKTRYSGSVYNGRNYDISTDSAGKWCGIYIDNVTTTYYKTATINNTNGTLTVEKISGKTYSYAQSGDSEAARNLRYVPSKDDWFQIRFKMDNTVGLTADSNICLDYMMNGEADNTGGKTKITLTSDMGFYDDYITVAVKIDDETFLNADFINGLRISFKSLTNGSTGNIYIDSIYIGPYVEQFKRSTDSLYFGFDDTPADQVRYANHSYGGYNFDHVYLPDSGRGIGNWATSETTNASHADYSIDIQKGTLNLGVKNGTTGSGVYGPYLETTGVYKEDGMTKANAILKYRPQNANVVQVRFRVNNCKVASGAKSRVVFLYAGYDQSGNYLDYSALPTIYENYTIQDGYMTVSIPVHQAFRDMELITNLGLRFQNIYSEDGTGLIEIDYIYVGPGEGAPYTYGYDSSYDTNSLYSDGESLFTEGNGVRTDAKPNPDKYTETRFSFTGTGFDLISRTGANQGTIRVEIHSDDRYTKESRLYGNEVNLKGELELYQIPVYSKHDLPYGTYYVSVMVNSALYYPTLPILNCGNEFYLDAIRIYDPIDVSKGVNSAAGSDSAIAYTAYLADIEAHPDIQEVRNILVTAEEFNAGGKIMDGAVFVDYSTIPDVINPTTGEDVTDPDMDQDMGTGNNPAHLTASVQTYKKVGPNNETYLGPQQLVAFQLLVYANKVPGRLDIGAKSIQGETTNLLVKIWDTGSNLGQAYKTKIQGPSHQYYSLYLESDVFKNIKDENGRSCYMTTILISNPTTKTSDNDANVLSITDIRAAFKDTATRTDTGAKRTVTTDDEIELPEDSFEIRYVVMGDLKEIVDETLKDMYHICDGEHIPGDWQTVSHVGIGQEGVEQIRCTRCGAVLEEKTIPAIAGPTFAGASVALQSDLTIYYRVNESDFLNTEFSDPYVVINDNGEETVIRDYTVGSGSYAFAYRNIAPHRMGDTITATLYATYNGQVYACQSKDYSVADYCYNMLGKTAGYDSYATLRTLLVDLLLYGEMSQQYTGYRTDSLCTARLTEEQRAMGTELTRELVSLRDQNYGVMEDPTVKWMGAGLNLRESVAVRFKISADTYEGLEVHITLEGKTYIIEEKDFDYRADGTYVHFRSINAAQMSAPMYVTVYCDGKQVSNTVRYSIESYAYAKQNDTATPHLADLVKRMMCYGDSARAYVGK